MDLNLDRAPTLASQVAARLSEAIANGDLAPGDRLVEVDLASRLGVSRAPLREALRELAGSGLVIHRAGRGAFVANPSAEEVANMSVFRAIVEGSAARMVAAQCEATALERLDELRLQMEVLAERGDQPAFIKLHWQLHREVCVESGNPFLLESWDGVSRLLHLYFSMAMASFEMSTTVRNNRAYLAVLKSGDPDAAEALFRSLIITVAFKVLRRPIPAALSSLVTVYVDEQGAVRRR